MLETDADRLQLLQALGGQTVAGPSGEATAIFDPDYVLAGSVDETAITLSLCTSDAERIGLNRKGADVTVGNETYRVRTPQPDGVGMTLLILEQ
jgi:hypothetical protein